jgi:hypothetical protein
MRPVPTNEVMQPSKNCAAGRQNLPAGSRVIRTAACPGAGHPRLPPHGGFGRRRPLWAGSNPTHIAAIPNALPVRGRCQIAFARYPRAPLTDKLGGSVSLVGDRNQSMVAGARRRDRRQHRSSSGTRSLSSTQDRSRARPQGRQARQRCLSPSGCGATYGVSRPAPAPTRRTHRCRCGGASSAAPPPTSARRGGRDRRARRARSPPRPAA